MRLDHQKDTVMREEILAEKKRSPWGRRLAMIVSFLVVVPIGFLGGKSVMSSRPDNLGAVGGQLPGCPDSPNCVSTSATDDEHSIAPLTFEGSAADAMVRLKSAIESLPRTVVVTANESYLHAEFTTLFFRYVDDVECQIDEDNGQIQIRSASRTGYSDMGANRTRVEEIRAAFASSAP